MEFLALFFWLHIWNLSLFLQILEFLSYPSIANIEILALSFQTMEFWPIIYTHWFFDLKNKNTGMLALFLWALELWSYDSKEWNSSPFFINTGILTLSFQTLELSYFPSKHWNSGPIFYTLRFGLILRNTGILALFL